MRMGVVVDSSCDLPSAFIEECWIGILPITICLQGQDLIDRRDPQLCVRGRRGAEVFDCIMGATGGINVGAGALASAFAAGEHALEL